MKLSSGETVLYSRRDDDQHMQGVAIMMNQEATKALIDWSWKFIGHIMRKEPNNDCRTALTSAPEGRRKRGRPRTT